MDHALNWVERILLLLIIQDEEFSVSILGGQGYNVPDGKLRPTQNEAISIARTLLPMFL